MERDPLNKFITIMITALVGIILVVGAFLPIASSMIKWVNDTHTEGSQTVPNIPGLDNIMGGSATVTTLLSMVVIMVLAGLIIGVVSYLRSDK